MYSYEEKMRAVELYLKYGLSAAAVINELEQHIKKNKLPAKDQRVVLSHNNYIMVVVRLSATIRHFRLQSKSKYLLKREQVALPPQLGVKHLLFLCPKPTIRSVLKPLESLGGVNFYSPLFDLRFC